MRKILIFTLTAVALAQAPIQVTTRLVEITVVVRDKRGAVADLSKSNFEILDKGKPRKIATFSVTRANDRVPRAPLPPNTFSNRLDRQRDSAVTATVLLMDGLNTAFKDQAAARQQLLTLLKSLDPASPIAIYALGNNLRIVHDFTEDPARLTRALQNNRSTPSALLADSQSATDSARVATPPATSLGARSDPLLLMDQVFEPLRSYALDRRVAITVAAMNAIANRMAGVPGRKNLIWVSGAFPLTFGFDRSGLTGSIEHGSYLGLMNDAAAAIDHANVAVYPVDPRGLIGPNPARISRASGSTLNLPPPDSGTGAREIATMELLADWTGGRAFYNTNDLSGAVKQAMEDAEVIYSLGFYPEEKDLDGSYHEVKIKVDRKGAAAHYRKGYFATPLPAITSQTASPALRDALLSPVDATAVGLTASLTPDASQAGRMVLALVLDLPNLSLAANSDHWNDVVHFAIAQEGANGAILDTFQNAVKIDVTDQNREQLLHDGVVLKLGITPAAGLSQIRIAVMDQATGNVGSLRFLPRAGP
ncbi:MAG: VWA domain-containing protein [Acidobacteriota bacterium]|nr:VWA domain-containing protein [Acidobacteriota bacterium]